MKLNLPKFYGQRDPLWSNKKLGTSTSSTIGDYGCLLICHAMLLSYYGHDFHPDDLNEFYKTRGVFDQATLINYYKAGECFPDFKADEYVDCYDVPAPLDKIDKYLVEGKPVIALVDFTPGGSVNTHFVVIYGKDQDYLIWDPWYAETYYFTAKYGDPATKIFGLRLYSGPIPEGGVTIESLNAHIQELTKQITDQISANAELRNINVKLQGEIAETDKINQQLVEDNRKAEMARINAENNASDLQGKLDSSQRALEDCLALYNASQEIFMTKTPSVDFVKELIRRFLRRR